jgi:hypothetical protein
MSYILNALKKAEQERLRDDPKDLEDFASARWDPYEQKASSNKVAIIVIFISLVIVSALIVIYQVEFQPLAEKTEALQDKSPAPQVFEYTTIEVKPIAEIDPFALPILEISGHMFFAEGSKSNRLFANDQSFKEGDLIANGWRLTAIRIDGIEMAKQKRSVFVAYP